MSRLGRGARAGLAALLAGACASAPRASSGGDEAEDGERRSIVPPAADDGDADADVSEATDDEEAIDTDDEGPTIDAPTRVVLHERVPWSLEIEISDPGSDDLRVFAAGLPPGAHWDEPTRTLSFRPDFIQGGARGSWEVALVADDGEHVVEHALEIDVADDIHPPEPTVVHTERGDGFSRLRLEQRTDPFLDSPGWAGRSFDAVVTVPDVPDGETRPVRIVLHGFNGSPSQDGWKGEFRIAPHDPSNTYWWGYASSLPDEVNGEVPGYTQRRILALLEWVLHEYPTADPTRVWIEGRSMGGAGAAAFGLLHGRHVAYVDARQWQAIPRNHRPSRIAQLSGLWGSPDASLPDGDGLSVWDRLDVTRMLLHDTEPHPWIFSQHGKDDPTIHFGAAVLPSPSTGQSLYDALQTAGAGHLAVWDEGAHGPIDPVLGARWWQRGWNPIFDRVSFVRTDLAYPAFSHAAHDDDPGDGGNGGVRWNDETGYAANVEIAGDTGWNGDIAGALSRFLRWDARAIVDTFDRFEVPLRVLDRGEGRATPPGYPTTGDDYDGPLPATADITLRRVQRFRCRPGETVAWHFGREHGEASADARGLVTIEALPLTTRWTTLVVTRLR